MAFPIFSNPFEAGKKWTPESTPDEARDLLRAGWNVGCILNMGCSLLVMGADAERASSETLKEQVSVLQIICYFGKNVIPLCRTFRVRYLKLLWGLSIAR